MFQDVVLVTAKGAKNLTRFEKVLEIWIAARGHSCPQQYSTTKEAQNVLPRCGLESPRAEVDTRQKFLVTTASRWRKKTFQPGGNSLNCWPIKLARRQLDE